MKTHNKKPLPPKQKKAFALILALALMGFMMLLVVTLATMVQMQLRLSRQSLNTQKARQAAKFAAYQAMSQIQTTLGPDQRITANAKMFDDNLASAITEMDSIADGKYEWWDSPLDIPRTEVEAIDGAIGQNRYWVGVWDSRNGYTPSKVLKGQSRSDYSEKTMDKAITWLVSGNGINESHDEKGTKTVYKPYNNLESGKYVRAVSKGSYTDETGQPLSDRDVLAPLISLEKDPNPLTGEIDGDVRETRIAWWVGDEGQKASLNAVASREDIKTAERIDEYRLQSLPFYSGIHGLTIPNMGGRSGVKAFDFSFDDSDDDQSSIGKIRSLDDIAMLDVYKSSELPETTSPSKVFFHAVTFNTKGVLVNVREGGLKKDLSIGLLREDMKDSPEEELSNTTSRNQNAPKYYEQPIGVAGFNFKSTAYPLVDTYFHDGSVGRTMAKKPEKELNSKGHIFGPQMFGHEDMNEAGVRGYDNASTISIVGKLYADHYLWKDPGGPLWDQLRSYYNLRVENNPSVATLSARVQTDDRMGFKPVVKRFQVFHVPTFVKYNIGGYMARNQKNSTYDPYGISPNAWGLRLHMIPLLVLWNPYDTKIKGDTYYAIRLASRNQHPLGVFRFAIGYDSNGYFQCLRDLRTEFAPSMDFIPTGVSVQRGVSPLTSGNAKKLYQGLFFPLKTQGSWDGTLDYNYTGNYQFSITKNDAPRDLTLSQKTYFYQNMALPLGYGKFANPSYNYNAAQSWWVDIVKEDANNLYPTPKKAYEVAGGKNKINWAARVATIPLYLNNLIGSVVHGSPKNADSSNKMFRMQKEISCVNTNEQGKALNPLSTGGDSTSVGTLIFLAYDKSGIEPGEAKIFAMENIVNYLGDGKSGTTKGGDCGPNGNLEGNGKEGSPEQTPYYKCGAIMKGISEGGQFGGCFYIDVPHGEAEHSGKYIWSAPWDVQNVMGGTANNIIFDLNLIQKYRMQMRDSQGNYPPLSIDSYLIDMDDMAGFQACRTEVVHYPLFCKPNTTPIGYGQYSFSPDYAGSRWNNKLEAACDYFHQHRHTEYYCWLDMQMWIWFKEGLRLGILTNYHSSSSRYPEQSPTMMYVQGYRIFLGDTQHSFPEPSIISSTWSPRNGGAFNTPRNFHQIGYHGFMMNRASLRAYNTYDVADDFTDADQAKDEEVVPGNEFNEEDDYGKNGAISAESRARFYINWLPWNPRRHSANAWRKYTGQILNNEIGDLVPVARKSILTSIQDGDFKYQSRLHNAILGDKDTVPYGYVFALPYADNEVGSQPFWNRRFLVNNALTATAFNYDFCGQENQNLPSSRPKFLNEFGLLQKSMQAISQVYSPNSRDGGDGFSNVGYDIPMKGDSVRVGLRPNIGTSCAPLHHMLRKSEVISNPANLASAQLSFGVGYAISAGHSGDKSHTDNSHSLWIAYGVNTPDNLQTTFAIGNSLCPSRVSPYRSYQIQWHDGASRIYYIGSSSHYESGSYNGRRDPSPDYPEDRNVIYDMSWHLNNVLWDEYFFSTLPYREEDSAALNGEIAYPQNPRIKYYVNPKAFSEEVYYTPSTLKQNLEDHFAQNAAKFWLDGPFNVNSTEIDAWKAVLSTYYGLEVNGYDGTSTQNTESAAFHRWAAPFKAKPFTSGDSVDDEDTVMQGFRTLDNDELEELASAIVEHVKDRGPFYSMSHFVNRVVTNYSAEERYTDEFTEEQRLSLIPNQEQYDDRKYLSKEYQGQAPSPKLDFKMAHMQKGILQAAIDGTSINNTFHRDEDIIISTSNDRNMSDALKNDQDYGIFRKPEEVWENWRGAIGPQATGVTSYLMQQDILARIGSFLTVRSDTFKIRAYGEVRNPISGIVESKAWCEMVVQRVPDYIDETTSNQEAWRVSNREIEMGCNDGNKNYNGDDLDEYKDELSDLNKALGRRFKVVSFRWLNEKEI